MRYPFPNEQATKEWKTTTITDIVLHKNKVIVQACAFTIILPHYIQLFYTMPSN